MTVIQEEAEIVERISRDFLAGESQTKIAGKLTREGVTSVNGNPISVSAVGNILRNITYTGNTLLQKTFIRDPISRKKVMNTGELPQYFVKDTHEAIIDMDTFERVQEQFARNREMGRFPYNHTGKKYPFTMKVICGRCKRHYTRQLWNTSEISKKRPIWVCTGKKAEKYRRCDSKNISEAKLMEASAAVLGIPEFDENIFSQTEKDNINFLEAKYELYGGSSVTETYDENISYVINCEDSTTLWEEPDISSAELCQIPLGAAVNVLQGAPNGFVQVDYNGMTGFCLGSYLSEIQ